MENLEIEPVEIRLHFMERDFSGLIFSFEEAIESREMRLLFEDSCYWLFYRFFNCRDCLCSEKSSVIRTHLLNFLASLYRHFENVDWPLIDEKKSIEMIQETLGIIEYSREFPVCLWIRGDETSADFLAERLGQLPPSDQIAAFMELPHIHRIERERIPYNFDSEELALKRYRNELAAFNKRRKLAGKNRQRRNSRDD